MFLIIKIKSSKKFNFITNLNTSVNLVDEYVKYYYFFVRLLILYEKN